jgi:hypothetical protein
VLVVDAALSTTMISGHIDFRNRVSTQVMPGNSVARHVRGRLQTKMSKTTPCTVADPCRINDLRIVQGGLTRRAKHWQDGIIAKIVSMTLRPATGARPDCA